MIYAKINTRWLQVSKSPFIYGKRQVNLVHLLNKFVDVLFTVSSITTLCESNSLADESSLWRAKLEWPEEVVYGLEVWTTSDDFMNNIFNTDYTKFSELIRDDVVINDWNTLSINLGVSSLVDKGTNSFQRWGTIGYEWFYWLQHIHGGFVDSQKGGIVNLSETQQLQDLSDLRAYTIDTLNDEINFGKHLYL